MGRNVADDLDYDIPVFTSLGLKLPEVIIEDTPIDCLNNIDIAELYQKEPFKNDDSYKKISSSFSKTSYFLIFLVFIIFLITLYYYYNSKYQNT